MGIADIPRWVGPVVTPILLIIFVGIFCCYYCYWKPKKLKKNAKKPSKVGHSDSKTTPCQVKYADESYYYSCTPSDCAYGPFYSEICRVPNPSGLEYCPDQYRADKVLYFTRKPSKGVVGDVRSCRKQNPPITNTKLTQNAKIKIKKGHCLKSPNLPIIAEGDSVMEEEESISKFMGIEEMKFNARSSSLVLPIEMDSETSGDGTAHGNDSGYED